MDEKIKDLEKARIELKKVIDEFPEGRREEILFDKWSLKDTLSHFSGWNMLRVQQIKDFLVGNPVTWLEDWDGFNWENVNSRRSKTYDEVYAEFVKSMDDVIKGFQSIPQDMVENPWWPGHPYNALSSIQTDIGHWRDDHLPGIRSQILS